MKSVMKTLMLAAALSVAASAAQAADGVLIQETTVTNGTPRTHQIQIEKNRMRAETSRANGEKEVFLFDGAKQVMWIINYDKKTYSEMTKADIDRVGGQVNDAMAKMQEQLKSLPPEQRARVEAMMAGRGGMPGGAPAAVAKTEYKKVGTDKVGKWACDKYEGSRGGQKTSEMCTVDPQTLGFTAADFEVSRQLQEFFGKLLPAGGDSMFRIGTGQAEGFNGIPVRHVTFGAAPTTSEISSVTRQTFPESTFAVPEGFTKEASPFGGRGRQ
ncbi:MAG TPA: hypothetical protein VHU82_06865 [Vicinamibacterales bacterium]|nr:hypothetical protein [Vicinamibacterales bacterium]